MDLYRPSAAEPQIIDAPPALFLMADGKGDPNTSKDFEHAIQALYSCAYGLKFLLKKKGLEYHVTPLEGLWWAPDMAAFSLEHKGAYHWTLMISVPEQVTAAELEEVKVQARRKRPSEALEHVRLIRFHEGLSAQVMHVGTYATEGPTIAKLHAFIHDRGYTFDGMRQKHHEIYLGDPRRAAPDKLKTVIRQPIRRV
jgi:hypothetical protein